MALRAIAMNSLLASSFFYVFYQHVQFKKHCLQVTTQPFHCSYVYYYIPITVVISILKYFPALQYIINSRLDSRLD